MLIVPRRVRSVQSRHDPYGCHVEAPRTPQREFLLLLVIAAGGIAGSLARYGVSRLISTDYVAALPWATLSVNAVGCLLIGLLATALPATTRHWWVRPLLITGVLGGFTTFSAFAMETGLLLEAGRVFNAAVYVGATLLLGLLAVRLGSFLITRRSTHLAPEGGRT